MPPPGLTSFPNEIIISICRYLRRSDLRRLRLTCTILEEIARDLLFSQISVFRNSTSFCRLRSIVLIPRLRPLVRSVFYSGKQLPLFWEESNHSYEAWVNCARMDDCSEMLDDLSKYEKRCYKRSSCAMLHAERMLERYDKLERNDLALALKFFPCVKEIVYDAESQCGPVASLLDIDSLSTITRETLLQPQMAGTSVVCNEQLALLVTLVWEAGMKLKSFKGLGIWWDFFKDFTTEVEKLMEVTANCDELALRFARPPIMHHFDGDPLPSIKRVAALISNAPSLQSLEISQGYVPTEEHGPYFETRPQLSALFQRQSCWPHLQQLKIRGIVSSESELRGILLSHATTLKTLEIKNIALSREKVDGKWQTGSWVTLIPFLQEFLSLREITFETPSEATLGLLSTSKGEAWEVAGDSTIKEELKGKKPPRGGSWLKQRIERFIVLGGENPLQWLLDKNLQEMDLTTVNEEFMDESWYLHSTCNENVE